MILEKSLDPQRLDSFKVTNGRIFKNKENIFSFKFNMHTQFPTIEKLIKT